MISLLSTGDGILLLPVRFIYNYEADGEFIDLFRASSLAADYSSPERELVRTHFVLGLAE
jgi:hypothetical protein